MSWNIVVFSPKSVLMVNCLIFGSFIRFCKLITIFLIRNNGLETFSNTGCDINYKIVCLIMLLKYDLIWYTHPFQKRWFPSYLNFSVPQIKLLYKLVLRLFDAVLYRSLLRRTPGKKTLFPSDVYKWRRWRVLSRTWKMNGFLLFCTGVLIKLPTGLKN